MGAGTRPLSSPPPPATDRRASQIRRTRLQEDPRLRVPGYPRYPGLASPTQGVRLRLKVEVQPVEGLFLIPAALVGGQEHSFVQAPFDKANDLRLHLLMGVEPLRFPTPEHLRQVGGLPAR